MNVMNKLGLGLVALAPTLSMAAVDAGVTTAIESAKTDGLAVAGALLTTAVAIWGALYIKRKFFG